MKTYPHCSLIKSLAEIAFQYPRDEKILITSNLHIGQQILEALARSGTPWMNFKPATVFSLAQQAIEGRTEEILSEAGGITVFDSIVTRLEKAKKLKYFKKHSVNKGMIDALTGTIKELKTLRIDPGNLEPEYFVDPGKAADLKIIFREYQNTLKNKNLMDGADVLLAAIEKLGASKPALGKRYIILSNTYANATQKEFIHKLCGASLDVIDEERVEGLTPPQSAWDSSRKEKSPKPETDIERLRWVFDCGSAPPPLRDNTIELFKAAGCRNEICEVMRRIAANELSADDVELVYTDAPSYVSSIHAFCERVGIRVTFAEGVPSYFCAPGRVLAGFLMWIRDDFGEIYLRRLIKSGDLKLDDYGGGGLDRTHLAYLLGTSGVGWGRDRYARVLDKRAKEYAEKGRKFRDEEKHDDAVRWEKDAENSSALAVICRDMIALVPEINRQGTLNFAKLCEGCVGLLEKFARTSKDADRAFVAAASKILSALSRLTDDTLPVDEAVDKLLRVAERIRYMDSGPKPGHLHVSHYRTAGRAGRTHTFIVGMDELKFPGRGFQDPVLLDSERIRISKNLEVSGERMRKHLFDMALLLARARGKLTMSFSAYDVLDDRTVLPSSLMLQVLRVKDGLPQADYSYLDRALKDLICFNTGSVTEKHIDEIGWWLAELSDKTLLKDGLKALTQCYPGIGAGLHAKRERASDRLTEYDGLVFPRDNELDPRGRSDVVLSASRLEVYAKNPFGYFLEYILGVKRPEETKRDAASWLNSAERGSLLHQVFQRFIASIQKIKEKPDGAKKQKILYAVLNDVISEYKEEFPPSGEAVFGAECAALRADMEVFLKVNDDLGDPVYAELEFGMNGVPPVPIEVGDGKKILLRGRIDRVDRVGPHEYAVWDYKTGSSSPYKHREYIVGGTQIQHALYAKAAEHLLKKNDPEAQVKISGYALPTEKGERYGKGVKFPRPVSHESEWQYALNLMLDLISRGVFIPPDKIEPYWDDEDIYPDKERAEQIKSKIGNAQNKNLDPWIRLKECR